MGNGAATAVVAVLAVPGVQRLLEAVSRRIEPHRDDHQEPPAEGPQGSEGRGEGDER